MKIWQKNSSQKKSHLSNLVEKFTVGNDYLLDQALVPYDIRASIAHAQGLQSIDILNKKEVEDLNTTFNKILELWKNNEFQIALEDEDCHTAIEKFCIKELGETGKKIHTGRSRNDQVLVAMRLWERDQIDNVLILNKKLAQEFLNFAKKHEFTPMPGFTHTQIAMPMSVGMWAGSFAEMCTLNLQEIKSFRKIINLSPLGSAAGFGVEFNIPREEIAKKLEFDECLTISLTSQNTRGKIEADLVSHLSSLSATLAHFANDLVWFSSSQFQFFDVDPELTTGSSIMPQKKNLDSSELLRGSHSQILGYEFTLKNITSNLISGYHRDLQLSKEPTMKASELIQNMLEMAQALIKNITPNKEKLTQALIPEIFAADQANQLVKEGKSFREAYQEVGNTLENLKIIDIHQNLKSKKHLGATGNLGLEKLEEKLKNL